MLDDQCPDRSALAALALGRLPHPTFDTVANHVENCNACQSELASLDRVADALLRDLHCGPACSPDDLDISPRLERQLRAAEAIPEMSLLPGPEHTRPDESLPRQLGPYELLQRLGQGSMGVVYRARHTKLGRPVAVKLLAWQSPTRAAVQRFHREIQAVAALDHPNIVHAHDADEVDGQHFLVMEYVEGINLTRYVTERGSLPVAEACSLIRQAALALHHAHQRGFIHRDIKPTNLLRTPTGQLKLLDLGLARSVVAAHSRALTGSGQVLGTMEYMAPEQAKDSRRVDARSDLYSLGCTLYFLLAGRPPFTGGTLRQVLRAHAEALPPPLTIFRPDAPVELQEILTKLLAKRPKDRIASAEELARSLSPFLVSASRTAPASSRPASGVPTEDAASGHTVHPCKPRVQWLVVMVALSIATCLLGAIISVVGGFLRTR